MTRMLTDEEGSVLVEATIVITLTLVLLGGIFDFFFAASQYNSAMKAAERGARLAAVSNPVDSRIRNVCVVACAGLTVGDPLTGVQWTSTCSGATGACVVTGGNASVVSSANGGYDPNAMDVLVNGRANTALLPAYRLGMTDMCCGIAPYGQPVQAQHVTVIYQGTGLGFVGRPTGAVPTITVRINNLPFNFFFLRMLPGFTQITMPPISVTITGEDLFTPGIWTPA